MSESQSSFERGDSRVDFRFYTGEVLDESKHSETHVEGGGGSVGPYSGTVNPVRSSTVTKTDFWLKLENGTEKDVQLTGWDIPLRPGQTVTVVSAWKPDSDNGSWVLVVNHDAEKYWYNYTEEEFNELGVQQTSSLANFFFFPGLVAAQSLAMGRQALLGAIVVFAALGAGLLALLSNTAPLAEFLGQFASVRLVLDQFYSLLVPSLRYPVSVYLAILYFLSCSYYPFHLIRRRKGAKEAFEEHLHDLGTKCLDQGG